jgi:hypothetical protein
MIKGFTVMLTNTLCIIICEIELLDPLCFYIVTLK